MPQKNNLQSGTFGGGGGVGSAKVCQRESRWLGEEEKRMPDTMTA